MEIKRPDYVTEDRLNHFINEAILEDIGAGDYSTLSSVPKDKIQKAELILRQDCILAGVELAKYIYNKYDSQLDVNILMQDGQQAKKGDIILTLYGRAQSMLSMERLVLNCLQRMSGIATHTNKAVQILKDSKTQLLDTRKTTPNFRMCEKWAVHIGGASNHRFGLFDMIMLKDNHIDFAGGIVPALESCSKYLIENKLDLRIELETRNLAEIEEALTTGLADIIMLDNMSINEMREAVKLIGNAAFTEASGNITHESLNEVASTGVDYISSGALIYAAPITDMNIKAL